MLSMRSQVVFILAVAGLLFLPARSWAQAPQVQEQAATTVAPELEQIPLGQVVVTYENGEVTVKARNATLGQVLRAICSQIGAELDADSDDREPIVGTFGPGAAKDVLASLLIGSHFNYVMQASDDDPKVLARVIVVPKDKDSNAQDRFAQNQVTQPQVSSTPTTPVAEESGLKQMKELLMQAKAEVAEDGNGGVGDAVGGDAASLLRQVEEAYNKAVAAEAAGANPASLQTAQQAGAVASENPAGRPRHRGRH